MKYFTIKEMCASDEAKRRSIKNEPNKEQRDNITALINDVLDPAREELGLPIRVNSGFRCSKLNFVVGGSKTSQHCTGQAADLDVIGGSNAKLFAILREFGGFDQLIWEHGNSVCPDWVHVSYKWQGGNRGQVLMACKENGKTVYRKIV